MRLKLEEDYLQNTKNHEEEVQLRLKFESKLNNMHSAHRDLESKYKRVLADYSISQKTLQQIQERLTEKTNEVTVLKTVKADNDAIISQQNEDITNLKREAQIKIR